MIKVLFNNPHFYSVNRRRVVRIAGSAAKKEKKIKGTVEVTLVGDAEIRKINRVWRKKNIVTDVLSFAWNEEKKVPGALFGQIFISYPRIVRQAKEYGMAVPSEFARMLVHGLLHLAGHEHGNKRSEKKMLFLQEKIIKSVK